MKNFKEITKKFNEISPDIIKKILELYSEAVRVDRKKISLAENVSVNGRSQFDWEGENLFEKGRNSILSEIEEVNKEFWEENEHNEDDNDDTGTFADHLEEIDR